MHRCLGIEGRDRDRRDLGLVDQAFVRARCEADAFADWAEFVTRPENAPEASTVISPMSTDGRM